MTKIEVVAKESDNGEITITVLPQKRFKSSTPKEFATGELVRKTISNAINNISKGI